MDVTFLLVCDGPSDAGLGNHIQNILIRQGADQVNWTHSHTGRRLTDRIRLGLLQSSEPDVLFIHRDAETAEPNERFIEITSAVSDAEYGGLWVGIVPRRMTEAWLLLDGSLIREVVGRPRGREVLGLPSSQDVERLSDPKERLREAFLAALSPQGKRRRKRFDSTWLNYRSRLLEILPIGGPLEEVPSWARFREDTIAAMQELEFRARS